MRPRGRDTARTGAVHAAARMTWLLPGAAPGLAASPVSSRSAAAAWQGTMQLLREPHAALAGSPRTRVPGGTATDAGPLGSR